MKKTIYYSIIVCLLLMWSNVNANPDLRSKIGQMIMVGFGGGEIPDSLEYDLRHRNLGGVICLAYNIDNPEQIKALTDDVQSKATTPVFIAVDEEGGIVARLDENNGYEVTRSHYTLGTRIDLEDTTRSEAAKMALWLTDAGFNLNLAPVVDVNVNPDSPAIGFYERSFSDDPVTVYRHASWFIDEFHKRSIMTSLKHYPGHGNAIDDSHDGFTDISNTWSFSELLPYEYLIKGGYSDFVMAGHLYNSILDEIYPATLSYNTITTLLRDSLNFEGAVISDAMYMRAIIDNYSFDEAIELAINAGVDVLLYTTNMRDERSLPGIIIDIVEEKVNQGIIPESRIDEAYEHIMALKSEYLGYTPVLTESDPVIPDEYTLTAYPNPFNNSTNVMFELSIAGHVEINLFNIRGQLVKTLAQGPYNSGQHRLHLDGAALPSGVYFIRMQIHGYVRMTKVSLIK